MSFTFRPLVLISLVVIAACSREFPVDEGHIRGAVGAFDAGRIESSIEAIVNWHSLNATHVDTKLEPGVSDDRISEAFRGRAVTPTGEMRLLWSRYNGQTGDQPFIWYHDLLSVDEAVAEYDSLTSNPLYRWDPRFVPIFSFQGEWYAVFCAGEEISAGPVVHYFLEDEPRVVYRNLTTMMATMATGFESGAITWDHQRRTMIENTVDLARIHRNLNPGYPFPYFLESTELTEEKQ